MKTSEVMVTNVKAVLEGFGDREVVVMPLSRYREIMEMIEDLEVSIAVKRAMETSERLLPYGEVRERLVARGILG